MRILILDDHRLFLEGLGHVLAQLEDNVDIVKAQCTEQALTLLDEHISFDLILADLSIPGLDGFAFLESLRQRRIFVPVVVISASSEVRDVKRALDNGALGFIPKALDGERLIAGLRKVLMGDIYVPPDLWQAVLDSSGGFEQDELLGRPRGIGKRPLEVLRLMAEGKSNREIATVLDVTEATVKSHVTALFRAFGVKNRTACVRAAAQQALINLDS